MVGYVSTNEATTLNQIGFWDAKERKLSLSKEGSEAKGAIVEEFTKWVVMEEIS